MTGLLHSDIPDTIHNGDCLEVLKTFSDNSVDAVVTDPPYGLSFMGKKWDYDVPSIEIWQECLRVLKHGGYLLAFAGTRTQHRMAVRIEDAGFEIRDMIAWVYGSGFPKSLNIGKAVDKLQGNEREVVGINKNGGMSIENGMTFRDDNWKPETRDLPITQGTSEWEGWGTALKPALEPITVARKPLSEKSVAENVLKWGTGGINIDECRVGTEERENNIKDLTNMHKGSYGKGGYLPTIGKDKVIGRFPANLIHDGSDEVLSLFPMSKSTDAIRKNNRPLSNAFGKYNPDETSGYSDSGNASRFFYCAKASKSERNKGLEGMEEVRHADRVKDNGTGGDNPRNRTNTPKQNFHPTVKPIKLMEYLVKLVSRENAVVLDPFAGSGSTGIACKKLNRRFIGIELSEEYCEIARKRIEM